MVKIDNFYIEKKNTLNCFCFKMFIKKKNKIDVTITFLTTDTDDKLLLLSTIIYH